MPKKSKPSLNSVEKEPRVRKSATYKSFRLSRKIKQPKPIVGAITILRRAFGILRTNKKLFIGIASIYGTINFLLSQLAENHVNFVDLKTNTEELLQGQVGSFEIGFALFGDLISSSSPDSADATGVYKSLLSLVVSLAAIWALRQVIAGERVSIKNAFYKGMYPLVPFLLVILVIGIQTIPLLISNLLALLVFNGIAVTAAEQVLWMFIIVLIGLLSVYMILSSIFAAYIVTLPNMTPMKALRSARALVLHRRIAVSIRLLFFAVVAGVTTVAIILPIIFLLPMAAEIALSLVSGFVLVLAHSYVYSLYRSLL